ncbi:CheR family methyltransferase [Arhodomonas sp. AD133]|uniref:CheR family methyltransferase n=1 Tax=Arhodomonas sp. AD133 TaxID=3415009 RepID=UPI003EBAE2D9
MTAVAVPTDAWPVSGERVAGALPRLDDRAFERWAALLRARTGIDVPSQRRTFLAAGLAERVHALGLPGLDAYYRHLTSGAAGPLEWSQLVDRLTVQETRFFRDPSALAFIRRLAREAYRGSERPIQVWSAGCATGEEAYTLALVLDAELADEAPFAVTGTDISFRALAFARRGEYSERRLGGIPESLRERGVERLTAGRFRIAAPVRRRACFLQMNLLSGEAVPLPAMDLIYCQNVLIYFDRHHRECLIERLAARLRPGGTLVLGGGEMVRCGVPGLRRVSDDDVLAFRKDASG